MQYRSKFEVDYKQPIFKRSHKKTFFSSKPFLATASTIVATLCAVTTYSLVADSAKDSGIESVAEVEVSSEPEVEVIALKLAGQTETTNSTKQQKSYYIEASIPATQTLTLTPSKATDSTPEDSQSTSNLDQAKKQLAALASVDLLNQNKTEPEEEIGVVHTKTDVVTIKSGDTLSTLFSSRRLNRELHEIMQLGDRVKELKSVYPGQKISFLSEGDLFTGIELETSINRRLTISKQGDTYTVQENIRDFDTRVQVASSTIENSLFLSGQRAGMSASLIMELANIFGWDIDFALDIRVGDQFTAIYEEKYLDGAKIKDGTIIAAEFVNAGTVFRAVRYTNSQGETDYYSQDGRSMRKPFLRTPVDFARISSGFNLKRKHPILNKIRAHRGVDYAASTGTPIKASGDGKIAFRGTKGGYGRTIIVKHGTKYSTLYAHMDKYARSTHSGSRVKQGQIIGYVGKSGLATGPHLHYEFLVNGVHRNPLTVKLPDAAPLPRSEMDRFKAATADQFAQLDSFSPKIVAQN